MLKKDLLTLKSMITKFVDKDSKYKVQYDGTELTCKNEFFEFTAMMTQGIYGNFLTSYLESGKTLKEGKTFELNLVPFKDSLVEPNPELVSASFIKNSFIRPKINLKGLPNNLTSIIEIFNAKFNKVKPLEVLWITPYSLTFPEPASVTFSAINFDVKSLDGDLYFNLQIPKILSGLITSASVIEKITIYQNDKEKDSYNIVFEVINNHIQFRYMYKLFSNKDLVTI